MEKPFRTSRALGCLPMSLAIAFGSQGMGALAAPASPASANAAAKPAPSPAATVQAARGSAAPYAPGQRPADSLASPTKVVAVPLLDLAPSIHQITPPHDEPFLPDGPGRQAFVTNCVICHSPRYVTNQTVYPRSIWLSEVKKMASLYGAPIPPDQVDAITDYLVFFHGKEDPKHGKAK